MPNYKQTDVLGTQYVRANTIHITNPDGLPPSITFNEESVINLNTTKFYTPAGSITKGYNPTGIFHPIDPITGELSITEQYTYEQLYNILYGLYITLATERDQSAII